MGRVGVLLRHWVIVVACCEGQCHSSSPSPVLVCSSQLGCSSGTSSHPSSSCGSRVSSWQSSLSQRGRQCLCWERVKRVPKQHPAMGACFSPHLRCGVIKSSEWLLRNHSAEFGISLYNKKLAIKTRGREHCQPVCPAHLVCCGGGTQHSQLYSLTGAWCPLGATVTCFTI